MGFLQKAADLLGRLLSPEAGRLASIALHEGKLRRLRRLPPNEDVRAQIRLYEERVTTLKRHRGERNEGG
jgi:hypothetical protein